MPTQDTARDTLHLGQECVHVLRTNGNKHKIYLLGTNHVSQYSARTVRQLILQVEPDVVAIELCRRRLEQANVFGGDPNFQKRYRTLERIPRHWRKKAAGEMTRLRLTTLAMEYYAKESAAAARVAVAGQSTAATASTASSTANGTEVEDAQQRPHSTFAPNRRGYRVRPIRVKELYIAADIFAPFQNRIWYLEANFSNVLYSPQALYKIALVDLPIERTFVRLMSVLSDSEKRTIRQYESNFVELFLRNETGIMAKIWRANAEIAEVMINERNRYLADGLLKAIGAAPRMANDRRPVQVIGLVGRRHVDGIIKIWKSDGTQKIGYRIVK